MRKNATKLAAAVLSLAMVMTSVSVPASAAKTKKAKLNKTKATLYTNGSKSQKSTTLKLTVGGKKVKATFKSSNTKLLTVGKTTGKVTAKKNGTATVTATYKKKAYKCKITVKTYATSVSVKAKTLTLKEGKTATIKTTVKPSTASNKKVSFTSSNKSVATVSSKGKVTAKKAGTAKITVKALGAKKGVKAATVTVKVEKATPAPTETPLVTESPVPTETPSVATEGSVTVTANISGAGIKVVSGTAVYTAGTAEGNTFTTPKLPNGTYEIIVSKEGYEDVVVPVVINGDTNVTVELKTVALAVESVKAINAKQIEVKFNNTMDRATVEKIDNYKIIPMNTKDLDFPTENNIEDITLQDDAKTAIITLGKTADSSPKDIVMTNGYEYEVTVRKEIKSTAGKNLTDKSVTKIVSNDSTRPVTTEIKTLAPNLLQVTFSEPVIIANNSSVLNKNIEFVTVDSTGKELDDVLNNTVLGKSIISISNNGTSYVIELNNNLKQGSNYNLYVGSGNGITDYAGLKLTAEKHTFTYEADKEVTAVKSFTLLDGKTAKVTFTKPIKVDETYRKKINVYYNVDGVQGNAIATGTVKASSDAQSIKVEFDKLIPAGVKYFFVDGAEDLAGNKVEIGKFNITIPEYKTAEVSTVKLANKTTIEVEFNQDIDDEKSYFKNGDLAHNNKVRANIVLKDKDGKNVDIKNVELGKDSTGKADFAKRVITLYSDLGDGNNTLTINNLVDELGRPVTAYSGTVSYANSTEFSAKLKAGKTEDEDKTVAVLSIDESKALPTQASVENLKNWTVDTTYGKKTLAEVSGAKVKMVSNDVYIVEADKDAFSVGKDVTLSNLETAAGLTIPSTIVAADGEVSDIKSLAKTTGDMTFDGTTATINLKNIVIGSFSPSDFILVGKKSDGNDITANDYTVSYSNDTAKDAFASKIVIKLNNNVKLGEGSVSLTTAKRPSTTDIFGRKLQADANMTIKDTSKATAVNAYLTETDGSNNSDGGKVVIELNKEIADASKVSKEDFTVKTVKSGKTVKVKNVLSSGKVKTLKLELDDIEDYKVLETEEVSISYNKKISTADDLASSINVTTNSLRLTNISFGHGASKEKFGKDETITFTYNKSLNPDILTSGVAEGDVSIEKNTGAQTITTELGKFTLTKDIFNSNIGSTIKADYKISGKSIVITLKGLTEGNEVIPNAAWENSTITYDSSANETSIDKLSLDKVQALDGQLAAVSKNDDVLNDASDLTNGGLISYEDVEKAINQFNDQLVILGADGDKNGTVTDTELKAADVADAKKDDVEKAKHYKDAVNDAIGKTYGNDTDGSTVSPKGYYKSTYKDLMDAFDEYYDVFEVYTTLKAEKLQSILNATTITLPKTAKALLGADSNNGATIAYVDGESNEITDSSFGNDTESTKTITVKMTITSKGTNVTKLVTFTVKVPAHGGIITVE